jgi:hypothetical protein
MRLIPAFLLGLAAGAGAMAWFYGNGGEITVAGYELKPPPKIVTNVAAAASPPSAPRVVVRDITESASRSGSQWPSAPANAGSNKTPPAAPGNPPQQSSVDSRGEFRVVIRLPR